MEPDCAICFSPASASCLCEEKGFELAVQQAEQRMMTTILFGEIRTWVREHAQDYILNFYEVLKTRRHETYNNRVDRLTQRALYYYRARPHPSDILAADAELKQGINEDWRTSVQKYPEVLEYFYSLVDFRFPREDDPGVRDPPLSALSGALKPRRQPGEDGRRMAPPSGTRRPMAPPPVPPQYGYHGPPGY